MKNLIKFNTIVSLSLFTISCSTSMTPIEVSNTLPTLAKSIYIPQSETEIFLEKNKCKPLVMGRSYAAPLGLSVKEDLQNGAIGIDEWVKLDGGNAFLLKNFKWITVDQNGSTQLNLDFDTFSCENINSNSH